MVKKLHVSFWMFVFPCAILFFLFFVIPLFLNMYYSLTNYDGWKQIDFIGLENYIKLFKDEAFYSAISKTFIYTVVSLPVKVVLPLILAALMVSPRVKMKTLTRTLIYIPVLLSSLVVGITINWMFGEQYGLINYLLSLIGVTGVHWGTNPFFAKLLIIIASTWATTGFYMLIYIGALSNISEEMYEAAVVDGANSWIQFTKITIPLIKPTTFLVVLLSMISLLKEYALIQGVTQGGPGTATTYIVQYILMKGFDQGSYGYASAASVIIMIIFAIIAFIQYKFSNGGEV